MAAVGSRAAPKVQRETVVPSVFGKESAVNDGTSVSFSWGTLVFKNVSLDTLGRNEIRPDHSRRKA